MLPTAPFGRTGHQSTRVIFGAAALGAMSPARAEATLDLVHQRGLNHIDTAASYGESELRLQPWLATHRRDVFLATKTGDRTGDAARASLERSLTRLGVDQVDLIQLHNLVEPEEWETAHGPGGALEALIKARDEGLTRFIGVTGHGLRIAGAHLRSLERFDYDSVLLPVNFSLLDRPDYRADVDALLAVCAARNVAIQTIKAIARSRWSAADLSPRRSWYNPLTEPDTIGRAVRYVLSQPSLFLNSTSDATLLPTVFDAADGPLDRPSDVELRRDIAEAGITPLFDDGELERI